MDGDSRADDAAAAYRAAIFDDGVRTDYCIRSDARLFDERGLVDDSALMHVRPIARWRNFLRYDVVESGDALAHVVDNDQRCIEQVGVIRGIPNADYEGTCAAILRGADIGRPHDDGQIDRTRIKQRRDTDYISIIAEKPTMNGQSDR
jgi:hypothetical protein